MTSTAAAEYGGAWLMLYSVPAVDEWLRTARDAIAAAAGLQPAEVDLTAADERTLLDLARVAAHTSGDRTNAPLLCYLIGLTAGRSGASVETLGDAVARE
jgi:Domain of unknown function (DUF6457)